MGRKRKTRDFICARCGEATRDDPCARCGESPILDGRYRLHQVLGTGSEGTTYRAGKIDGGRIVAVKEMPLRRARDDKSRELLHREATILRQLHHKAIPNYLDDFTAGAGKNRAFYLVQEFIDGSSLTDEEQDHRYDVSEVLAILDELLEILIYLHGLSPPVIHRDIKPSNVMRRRDGNLVLIDFGSVRDVMVDVEMGGETVTGTFGYMAPEQMMGDASEASDLYGLGALAVKLLSRREPHTLLRHDRTLDWKPYVQAPRRVLSLLDSLLQPDPGRRVKNASEVRETIRWIREMSDEQLNAPQRSVLAPMTDLVGMIKRRGSGQPERRDGDRDSASTEPTFTPAGLAVITWLGITLFAFIGYPLIMKRDKPENEQELSAEIIAPDPALPDDPVVDTVVSTEITVGTQGLEVDTRFEIGTGSYPSRSGETAPDVTIVVFSDFVCDYCRKFAETLATVDDQYGDRVAVYFRDYPLDIHIQAYDAHEAARCAHAQGRFWDMHDILFANQSELERHHLDDYALNRGFDYHAFRDCMRAGETRLDIEIDRKAGRQVGITGVPTYVINGTKHTGAFGVEQIREYVDLELVRLERERVRDAQQEADDRLRDLADGA